MEYYPTKGYAPRFGWHCTFQPYAPHLKEKGRVWVECFVKNYRTYDHPECQGGAWILANELKIIKIKHRRGNRIKKEKKNNRRKTLSQKNI